jgi:hypothetical protein
MTELLEQGGECTNNHDITCNARAITDGNNK